MGLELRLTDDLVRIAASGGGLRFQATSRLTEDLVRIALAGSNSGARLYFLGMSSRLTEDLVRIALAGKGAVVFEN
ncbi:MAG: hypothetical protein WC543_05250 [Candidatus Omnitrophota bacterium]